MATPANPIPNPSVHNKKARWWTRLIKFVLLTVLAVVLFVAGTLVVIVSVLTPDRLTPIVARLANSQVQNARVEIGFVELSLRHSMPYLQMEIKDLTVLSTVRDSLEPGLKNQVPVWADTVLAVKNFKGGLNIALLPLNKLNFSDVVIDSPIANAVVITDSITNFDIIKPSTDTVPETPFDWKSLPEIKIKRFAIEHPGPMRYLDVATGTAITARFSQAYIRQDQAPRYTVKLDGNVQAPLLLQYFILPEVKLGLDGTLVWSQKTPWQLEVDGMSFGVSLLQGRLSTLLDIKDGLKLNTFNLDLQPIAIQEVLNLLPDSLKMDYGIPDNIETSAKVAIKANLDKPYEIGQTSLPYATINIDLPDSHFNWQKVKFNNMRANIDIIVKGDDLNKLLVRLNDFNVRGPATDLSLKATVSSLMDDPLFDGTLNGSCQLAKLPPILLDYIPGSLKGTLTANAHIKGRPSMLTLADYHRLHVTGHLALDRLYWVDADTINMVYAHHAAFDMGTNTKAKTQQQGTVDSLLSAKITVDSAAILHSDISMHMVDFKIGLGAVNREHGKNDRRIIPMGGGLHLGKFNLITLTDTAIVRMRDLNGTAVIRPHDKDLRTPEFELNLGIKQFSTGDRSSRLLFSDARTNFKAFLQPQTSKAKEVKHLADSLYHAHPQIPMDSIYTLALEIHNRQHNRYPRVHPRITSDSTEIIQWGTSSLLSRLLTEWNLSGVLTAKRAGLFTLAFPVRNRLTNINVTFNNDSLIMRNIRYKAGHSDFTLSGTVSNIRRAFTSHNYSSPLKIYLDLESDTVDVNQLAETVFKGSAYLAAKDSVNSQKMNLGNLTNEEELERAIGEHVQGAVDSMAPLLIPQNLEAEFTLKANNVLYSDLLLHNLRGKLLTYQGAMNLHELSARSDVGGVGLSALYVGRDPNDLSFGFGLKVNNFNIHKFLEVVPAIDSLMPLLRDFGGIISADIAATSRITPGMDLDLPTLNAAIKLEGDSLVLLDPDTFKSLSKWLFFKNKKDNIIKHMEVQMLVDDNKMHMYPFIFDIDRYKLGVQGTNDFALNFNYHIAVLKSPIPFKFGINISGNPDKFKIRLGGAKFNEKTPLNVALVDTTRVNLVRSIESIFRRGVHNARFARINMEPSAVAGNINLDTDTLTHADSLMFIREGLIPAPDTIPTIPQNGKTKKSKKSGKKATAFVPVITLAPAMAVVRRKEED